MTPDQPATTDPDAIAWVVLHPGICDYSVREWQLDRSLPEGGLDTI